MRHNYADYVLYVKALADEARLKIVHMLSAGQLCACNILEEFHFTQPTLSYHMKILTESGLVDGMRDGPWMRYTLNREKMSDLLAFMHEIIGTDGYEEFLPGRTKK